MPDYFGAGMRLYLDHLVDWDEWLRLQRGDDVDVAAAEHTSRRIRENADGLIERHTRVLARAASGSA